MGDIIVNNQLDDHTLVKHELEEAHFYAFMCQEEGHAAVLCKPLKSAITSNMDAPFVEQELEYGIMVPLVNSPNVARFVNNVFLAPHSEPPTRTHPMAYILAGVDLHHAHRGMWRAGMWTSGTEYIDIGLIDPNVDGRWAIRQMLLTYLHSLYRSIDPCSGEYHTGPFGVRDKRMLDPSTEKVLVDLYCLTAYGKCASCLDSTLVPEV